jgi:hypothetical protein
MKQKKVKSINSLHKEESFSKNAVPETQSNQENEHYQKIDEQIIDIPSPLQANPLNGLELKDTRQQKQQNFFRHGFTDISSSSQLTNGFPKSFVQPIIGFEPVQRRA